MSVQKIKVKWAAIGITDEQSVIVYTHDKDSPKVFYFEDTEAFCAAIAKKEFVVDKWAICIPDEICIKKSLELPAQSLQEACQMLEFELPSLVPISSDEIVYGCTDLKQHENTFEIGVYILRKEDMDKQLKPYHTMNIYPDKVVPDSTAVHAGFIKPDSTGTIFLCLESTTCHILTSLNGDTQDFYNVTNFDDLKIQELATEIVQKEYELQSHTDEIQIIAISESGQFENLSQSFSDLGVMNPISTDTRSAILPDRKLSHLYDHVLTAGAYQSVFDSRFTYLNLLPSEHLKLIQNKKKRKDILYITGMTVLVIALIWTNLTVWNWRTKRACRKVQDLIAPIKHIATDVEQKKLLVRAIQGQTTDSQRITDIFSELYKYGLPSVTISELRYHQKGVNRYLSLKGQTDSLPKAFDYSEAMKKSHFLKQMQINNVQQIPTPGGSIVEFKAECLLQEE